MTEPERGDTTLGSRPEVGGQFGHSWWARAWLEAVQQRAQLDPNRLPRGVAYARGGNVDDLMIGPGEVRAQVGGRERQPYRVRTFDDTQWAQVLDIIARRAGHTATMLAGQLPAELADDLADAALSLLPGPGELGPRCTCLDEADPCKHAAAVCYLLARALDNDPFLVLVLRAAPGTRCWPDYGPVVGSPASGAPMWRRLIPGGPPAITERCPMRATRAWTPVLSWPQRRPTRLRRPSPRYRRSGRGGRSRPRSISRSSCTSCGPTCWPSQSTPPGGPGTWPRAPAPTAA